MLKEFRSYIAQQSLFQKKDRILLAVSSGIDSVVLAHLFHHAGFEFGIAHCNFQLRGEDSDKDEEFVRILASELGTEFHSTKFSTEEYSTDHKLSTQMAARELRYDWFDKLFDKHNYQYIATAHHHNDGIETALFNFTKGTGISGMRGILPKHNHVVRPLLFATKGEIEVYASKHGLEWREDSSNASDKYHRNHLRHNVIPKLEQINPSFEQTSKNTLERLRDAEAIAEHYANEARSILYHQKGQDHYFKIEELKQLIGVNSVLYFWLHPFGFNFAQVKDIAAHLDRVGKIFPSSTHQANIDRHYLIISPRVTKGKQTYILEENATSIDLPIGKLQIEKVSTPVKFSNNSSVAHLDSSKLKFPLTIRRWQEGDKFRPLGMTGFKKVSDFLIDTKVPLNLKKRVYLLLSGDEIAWVIGHRVDDRYKISNDTKSVLKLSLLAD